MYLSYTVYFICLLLFLWGISVAPKGRFHSDYLTKDVIKSMRGLAAIGVILHHISQEEIFQTKQELGLFLNAGYLFVSLFFFSSGYGLLKKLDEDPNYLKGFLKKRLPVVIVPFYVSTLFYGIFNLITGNHLEPLQWVTNIIGITMMNEYAWYPIVLAILYVAFYFIFRGQASRTKKMLYMLAVILAMGMIFCVNGHFAWWAGSTPDWWMYEYGPDWDKWYLQMKVFWFSGEWWVNSQIAFLVGMLYETYEEKLTAFFAKLYPLKLVVVIILTVAADVLTSYTQAVIGYWSEFAGEGPAIGAKIICYIAQLPHVIFFTIFILVFTMKIRTINPITRFFGKYSLHTYLMNLMALLILRPVFLDFPGRVIKDPSIGMPVFIVSVFALTIILALIFYKTCQKGRFFLSSFFESDDRA